MAEMLEDRAGAASSQALVLVEDNPADARFIQEMALGGGPDRFELTAFSRLAEARSHLRSAGGACVLLDLSLPDATGLEAVETLRAEFAEIPIVIITGLDDEEAGVRALKA